MGYIRTNAVAFVALLVALGGSSAAAIAIPAASVGTRQLRNGAVTNAKIRRHSIRGSALAPGVIPRATGGPDLETTVVFGPNPALPPSCGAGGCIPTAAGTSITSIATCPGVEKVLGGGYKMSADNPPGVEIVAASLPQQTGNAQGWAVTFELTRPGYLYDYDNQAWAVCATR